ncbi:hypothetical protein J0H33_05245 [bacterium]|nr:hypothetical protein [bacterium]
MLLTIPSTPGSPNRWLRAAAVVTRAAFGLLIHALTRPCQPARINRTSGKVALR